jgi:hypothetical protein
MAPQEWLVEFDANAVADFEGVKGRSERRAALNAVDKLKELGPRLPAPHMKSLAGETDLFELRPRRGDSAVRPIYARIGNRFVVLSVAPRKDGFARALSDARTRLARYRP